MELDFTGDCSSILGTRPVITPSGKLRAKNDKKIHQKLLKRNCAKITLFFLVHFRIYSLKIFEGGGLGEWPPIAPLAIRRCADHTLY